MYLGAHMSISGGVHNAIAEGESIGCTAIQMFTKNNNRWKTKDLTDKEITAFKTAWSKSGIRKIVAHTGYLINLANPSENWEKSMEAMELEMIRAEQLGIPYLVLHPGSHLKMGEEYGLKKIADSLNTLHRRHPDFKLKVLLETTAGQGTNLGYTFEQLARILDMLESPRRCAICFDTCHAFAAGYELRTEQGYEATFKHFDKILGVDLIKAFHLNDSKGVLGKKLDRHAHIGEGTLGLAPFRLLLNDARFKETMMVLETPRDNGLDDDRRNLETLYSLLEK